MASKITDVLELNVGGQHYTVSRSVLTAGGDGCRLTEWFSLDKSDAESSALPCDRTGRPFIDRDGHVFAYVLDLLRTARELAVAKSRMKSKQNAEATSNGTLTPSAAIDLAGALPDNWEQMRRVRNECRYYRLEHLLKPMAHRASETQLPAASLVDGYVPLVHKTSEAGAGGFITIGYHGTFSFGRQGMAADVSFRKISRILVCGRVSLAREVFGDALNESRDPDRGAGTPNQTESRYTQRYFLKHNVLEQAFDACAAAGFRLVAVCGSGTNGPSSLDTKSSVGVPSEEDRWAHYNQFIFQRI